MAVTRAGGRSWKGALLVRNAKDAEIQDLLQEYTSARVSVCLEQRVCSILFLRTRGGGLFRDRPKGGGSLFRKRPKGGLFKK